MSQNMSGEDISFLFIATSGVIILVFIITLTCCLKLRRTWMNQSRNHPPGDTADWFQSNNTSRNELSSDERRELMARTSRAIERFLSLDPNNNNNNNDNSNQNLLLNGNIENSLAFRQLANVAASIRQNNNNGVNPSAINQLWWNLVLDSSFYFMDSIVTDGRQLQQQLSHKDQLTKEQQRDFLCNTILKNNRITISTPENPPDTPQKHTSTNNNVKEDTPSDEEAPYTTMNNDPVHTNTANSSYNGNQNDGIIVCQLVSDVENGRNQSASTISSGNNNSNNSNADSIVPNTTSNLAISTTSDSDALNCPICLDDIDEGDIAVNAPICHHSFHQDCLLQWLERNDLCPYCRQLVVTEEQWREAYQSYTDQSDP